MTELENDLRKNVAVIQHGYDEIKIDYKFSAENLSIEGYQKIKWHKVSEGDLPRNESRILVYYRKTNHDFYNICVYDCSNNRGFYRVNAWGDTEKIDAIAWMEIPKYSE